MTDHPTTHAWLIANPAAGQDDWAAQLAAAEATLTSAGWAVAKKETAGPGDATEFARAAVADKVDVVVVAGGDGTVNEALQGLAGQRHTALAVLPGGTVNVWATELGAEEHGADIAARIAEGRRRTVDLGKVNGRYFLMMASAGFDAAASAAVADSAPLARLKRLAGPLAYALAATRTAGRFRGRRAAIDLDGEAVTRRLLMLVVGNTRLYGGVGEITPRARADDGLLDVCILAGRGPVDLLRRAWSVARRRHASDAGIDYRRARRIVLDPPRPLRLQADGEDIGSTPATFVAVPDALQVIVLSDTPPGFLGAPDEAEPAARREGSMASPQEAEDRAGEDGGDDGGPGRERAGSAPGADPGTTEGPPPATTRAEKKQERDLGTGEENPG